MFGLRTDRDPFKDPRVRRAIAIVLNRPDIINRVLSGQGTLGNDSPFWSHFPSTDPSTHQRKQNIALAKALLAAAGQPNPKFTITTWNGIDLPDYAAAIQASGKEAGMDIQLEVMSNDDYYGGAGDYYAVTPWINRPATLTEYGAAGVPNRYLTVRVRVGRHLERGALQERRRSTRLPRRFSRRRTSSRSGLATKRLAGILLRDTPVITAYFTNYVAATSAKVLNYEPEAISQVRIAHTSLA